MRGNKENLIFLLEELHKEGIQKIIAFSGGSESGESAEKVAEESLNFLKDYPIAIVNGGTAWGLSKYITDLAKKWNIPVIGIYPTRGTKYAIKNIDFAIEVEPIFGESEWGDATEIFTKLPHGVEVIEGGLGTAIEFAYFMKINEGRVHYHKEPIYLVPIRSAPLPDLSNVSNLAHFFPVKQEVIKASMPDFDVYNGRNAAEYLVKKLNLSKVKQNDN